MANEKNLLKKFGLQGEIATKKKTEKESQDAAHMASPAYLRQSSALINKALKSGFDVLQLSNGDIVTTGTKTIVHKYIWDEAKGKIIKVKSDDDAPQKNKVAADEEFADEAEDA